MGLFFIRRPVFAWVLALMTMLIGAWSAFTLPVAQYPDIAPTTVRVSASYNGATAEAVENSVTRVIEDAMSNFFNLTGSLRMYWTRSSLLLSRKNAREASLLMNVSMSRHAL